jgi:hypothetical protein
MYVFFGEVMVLNLFKDELLSNLWESARLSQVFVLENFFFFDVHFLSILITFCIGLKLELYTLDALGNFPSHIS